MSKETEVLSRLVRIESRVVRLAGALGVGESVKLSSTAPVVKLVQHPEEPVHVRIELPGYDSNFSDMLKALDRHGLKETTYDIYVYVRDKQLCMLRGGVNV